VCEPQIGVCYWGVLDCLYVIETGMQHFLIRAEMGKNAGRKKEEVDADFEKAAHLAVLVLPFRHARLSAMKLAGDPNNPVRFNDNATADELRAEIMRRLEILTSAGFIDLQALPAMVGEQRIGRYPASITRGSTGSDFYEILIANCVNRCHARNCVCVK
jgi:hypothetical protein